MAESSDLTPPEIVEHAAVPKQALAAFVAQELEHWGFKVQLVDGGVAVVVGEHKLLVGVGAWSGRS